MKIGVDSLLEPAYLSTVRPSAVTEAARVLVLGDRGGAVWPGPMVSMFFPAALPDLQEARCETAEGRFRSSGSTFRGLHWTLDPTAATSPVGLTPLLGGRCDLEEPVHFFVSPMAVVSSGTYA